jgi:aspartyl/glutamyl-tRNA(Asn/Gln) amidotransferase C subunit
MSLDKDTVARIARLARLKVPDEELAPLADELSGIFAWIEQLNEVDTKNVEPMSSVSDVTLPQREDKVTDGGIAEDVLRREALTKILGTLSERERRVLELRYGLNGEQPRTLDEVGRTFQVTRERIRQIENQSLKKLRALADSQKLRVA